MTTSIIDETGKRQSVDVTLEDYAAADAKGMKLSAYLNNKYDTAEGTAPAYNQILATSGIILNPNRAYGEKSPTMHQMLGMGGDIQLAGNITRNDGSDRLGVSGRMLFPSVIIELAEASLLEDYAAYEGVFQSMVAQTTSVDSPRFDQPIIDVSAPRSSRSMPISQNAEPTTMVSISLSEKSYKIPTFAIGLNITDEAMKSTTIDLVGIALREQLIGERAKVIDESLTKMIAGDIDLGIAAIANTTNTPNAVKNASSYDATATTPALFSQKAFLKWLREDWQKMSIDTIICDFDTFLAVQDRVNKPLWTGNVGTDNRLNVDTSLSLPGLPGTIKFFPVAPAIVGGTGKMVGIDSKRAIRKVVMANSSYSAVENFVLRRSQAFRFDWSESYWRLIDGAWKVLNMA